MKKLLFIILALTIIGCTEDKQESSFDFARFAMDCKKVASKLKVDFIVDGSPERPGCTVGQKDKVYGGLSGSHFTSREALQGALSVLWLQRTIPMHNDLQKCSEKCKNISGTENYLQCWRPCGEAVGYYEEND